MPPTTHPADEYFSFYGYSSVTEFQKAVGLPVTGQIDETTNRAFKWPRCGVRDNIAFARTPQWSKRNLTWTVKQYVRNISPSTQVDIFTAAFKAWDEVCGIAFSFQENNDQADIVLSTGRGRQDGFDGPGNTLAWAELANDVRQLQAKFDMDELWVSDPNANGVILYIVALHEFGHLLGISHIQTPGNVMNPVYNPRISTLQAADKTEAINRYGKNPTPVVPPDMTSEYIIRVSGKVSIDNHRILKLN